MEARNPIHTGERGADRADVLAAAAPPYDAARAPSGRREWRRPSQPRPAKPARIMTQVVGSGTGVPRAPSVLPAASTKNPTTSPRSLIPLSVVAVLPAGSSIVNV